MSFSPTHPLASAALLLARIIGGGALLLAASLKLQGDPLAFALSIESFKLLPKALIPAITYFFPVFEVVLGVTLIFGVWARQSALLATGLYVTFTLALASVLIRGLNVDCGCFAGLIGGDTVTWFSVFRNAIFIVATGAVLVLGAGAWSVDRRLEPASAAQ